MGQERVLLMLFLRQASRRMLRQGRHQRVLLEKELIADPPTRTFTPVSAWSVRGIFVA